MHLFQRQAHRSYLGEAKGFLFTFLAGGVLFFSACAATHPIDAEPRLPAAPANENAKIQVLDLSGLPDRLAVYDDTISDLKKEIALIQEQNASLKQRLDHIEQQ